MNAAKIATIKKWAVENYEKGGDVIVECYTDAEIAEEFKSLADAKRFCKHYKERETEVSSSAL